MPARTSGKVVSLISHPGHTDNGLRETISCSFWMVVNRQTTIFQEIILEEFKIFCINI